MSPAALPGLAVLISGRGSNLQAFIDACASGELPAQISVVISNNPGAEGLQRAARAGITTCCIDHRDYGTREEFDQALVDELHAYAVELVVLAGFMRILTPVLIKPFLGRLVNIHPSLLPKYPGLHTHQRALDAGPPVLHARVPVLPADTADSLAARVSLQEHLIYPLAVRWFLQGRLQLDGDHAVLDGRPIPTTGIQYTDNLC